jgi:hypothetical protein
MIIGMSYREMAQTLGTEWGRKHSGENVWVGIAMHMASLLQARWAGGFGSTGV